MAETDSKYHLQIWNENIKLYNEKYNTQYTYKYIVENFTEVIKYTNADLLLFNPNDDGHNILYEQPCHLCMCDTKILDRFFIYDPNNENNKMIVGCKCIEKIDEDINRIIFFNMICNKCNNKYPFKPSAVNGELCKGCYKEKKKLIKEQEKERIKNEKIQQEQILKAQQEQEFLKQVKERKEKEEQEQEQLKIQWRHEYIKQEEEKLKLQEEEKLKLQEQSQIKLKIQEQIKIKLQAQEKNEIHKCKCGKGTYKNPYKNCFNCNNKDMLKCKCGKFYKKPFKCCYTCNINKNNNTDNTDNTDIEIEF